MIEKKKDLSFFNKKEIPNAKGLRFSIVVSEWNQEITEKLYKGAYNTLREFDVLDSDIKRYEVPGSYELVFGAKIASREYVDAIICLGSIIKGDTKHFDFICSAVSLGIKDLNIALEVPVIFGVLTDDNLQQAIDRSGGKHGNKGVEAAITAVKMATLNKHNQIK